MVDFMKMQHNCVLDLTKWALENCKDTNFMKENVFLSFKKQQQLVQV